MASDKIRTFTVIAFHLAFACAASAGVPRGVRLIADEQIADETTGTTIARGRAEISVEKSNIRGSAAVIEVRPKIDEVLLKGGAEITIGRAHYKSETLSCTLDFRRCIAVDADQPLPASAEPLSDLAADVMSP